MTFFSYFYIYHLPAWAAYYAKDAETWEKQALTRARVAWATSETFALEVEGQIRSILQQPRDRAALAKAVKTMRKLIATEKPAKGFWDLKLVDGGLVDIEFAAQFLQLADGVLARHTGEALKANGAPPALHAAWSLQQDLIQVLKVAIPDAADPATEPAGFRSLLAKTAGVREFRSLTAKLKTARGAARKAFDATVR